MYYVTLQGIDSVTERIVWGERGHSTLDTVAREHQENKKWGGETSTLGYIVVQIGLQPILM